MLINMGKTQPQFLIWDRLRFRLRLQNFGRSSLKDHLLPVKTFQILLSRVLFFVALPCVQGVWKACAGNSCLRFIIIARWPPNAAPVGPLFSGKGFRWTVHHRNGTSWKSRPQYVKQILPKHLTAPSVIITNRI